MQPTGGAVEDRTNAAWSSEKKVCVRSVRIEMKAYKPPRPRLLIVMGEYKI